MTKNTEATKADETKRDLAAQAPAAEKSGRREGHGASHPGLVLKRVLGLVFEFYPIRTAAIIFCIVLAAILTSLPSVFMQRALEIVGRYWQAGDWAGASAEIAPLVLQLIGLYVIAITCNTVQGQLSAIVTQGTLMKIRNKMFGHMEGLPIRYFDQNQRGDIMSTYTNDVDTLRQLISQALPNLLTMVMQMVFTTVIMLWYSIPLTLVVFVMVFVMMWLTRFLGGRSARFFLAQQVSLAKVEGFAEEAMSGQKVVKVFTHERQQQDKFDEVNEKLFEDAKSANIYGNTLAPVLMNLGNIAYVIVALAGGTLIAVGAPSLSVSGMVLGVDIVVPFLNLTKRFAGSIGQVSQQINFVVMGLAGAERIFGLLDQESEHDEGYVTLVNAKPDGKGDVTETTPSSRVTSASRASTSATRPTTWSCTTSRCSPSPVRRWPSSARPVPARRPSRTSSTASTTSRAARSATTASTSPRSARTTCAARSASSCRTSTCSRARSWTTSATAA